MINYLIQHPYYFPIIIEVLFVAKMDLKDKYISNFWSLLHLIFYLMFLIVPDNGIVLSFMHWKLPIICFCISFILFGMNIMGGGDGKYFATLILLLPIKMQERFLHNLMLEICIGVICYWLIIFIMNKFSPSTKKISFFGKVPFAPFIAVAFLVIFIF